MSRVKSQKKTNKYVLPRIYICLGIHPVDGSNIGLNVSLNICG